MTYGVRSGTLNPTIGGGGGGGGYHTIYHVTGDRNTCSASIRRHAVYVCCTSQSECWFNVDVLVRGRGSSTVGHKDRDGVVDQSVFGAARPEHRDVLGDGQQKGAERVVLGAARQPAVALLQREAYRREAVDRKDNQHPDGRVAAVEKQKKRP